jgi:hypothetical protein
MQALEDKGVDVGAENFKGLNDGDAGFIRAIWCLTRRLAPITVVESVSRMGLPADSF